MKEEDRQEEKRKEIYIKFERNILGRKEGKGKQQQKERLR